jgi:hypothetical protein
MAEDLIVMPTWAKIEETARNIQEKYHLPDFAYGIDGTLIRFDGAVHGFPVGPGLPNLQNFCARKMHYAINALVVANDQRLILAANLDWHGAAHDAREMRYFVINPKKP